MSVKTANPVCIKYFIKFLADIKCLINTVYCLPRDCRPSVKVDPVPKSHRPVTIRVVEVTEFPAVVTYLRKPALTDRDSVKKCDRLRACSGYHGFQLAETRRSIPS